MPGSSYEERLRELDQRYEEQVRIARRNLLTNKITLANDQLPIIERQIKEARDRNRRIVDERNRLLNELQGQPTSIADVFNQLDNGLHRDTGEDFDNQYLVPVTITNELGETEELIPVPREEIERLEKERDELLKSRRQFEDERREILSEITRENTERKNEIIDREEQIKQAYTFFTYMDTATSKGYDVSNLTEAEVLDLYNEFYNKRHEPGYQRIWDETNEKILKGDREVVWSKGKTEIEEQVKVEPEEPKIPAGLKEEELKPVTLEDLNVNVKPTEAIEKVDIPVDQAIVPVIEPEPEEAAEELVEGTKSFKGKLAKFKEWAKRNKKQLIKAGLIVGGVALVAVVSGSIIAGAIAAGAATVADSGLGVDNTFNEPVNDIMMPEINPEGLNEQVLEPTQTIDLKAGPENGEFFTNSEDAVQGINAVEANNEVGPFQVADFNNPTTHEYAEVNPNELTPEQVEDLTADGYTVPAYTNDPNVIGLSGEQLAEQNQISGFGRSL